MTKKIIFIILAVFAFSSCSDSWEENLTKNKIVKHEWLLYMYVDGVQNEMIELQDIRYDFKENGDLVKTIDNTEIIHANWKLIDKDFNLSEITSKIKDYRTNSNIFVNVNTIDYMIQGGRVSPMKGFFARLFNLKPIISLDENGEGIIWGKAFSRKSVNKKILNQIKEVKESNKLEKYNVVHADAEEMAEDLAAKIEKIVGYGPEYIMNISSITALNSGKDAVAVSYLAG